MVRFKFRLEASLHLAENKLEQEECLLAEELRRLGTFKDRVEAQRLAWLEALEGQQMAAETQPEHIGLWQRYASQQMKILRRRESELAAQNLVVENKRTDLTRAYQDVEKIKRLKGKKYQAFLRAEQRREEKALDEAGQLGYWRQSREVI